MWGTPKKFKHWVTSEGITPTCVGNTFEAANDVFYSKDHPHLCGEHPVLVVNQVEGWGSPPPVWGTHGGAWGDDLDWRITPTCVGNTRNR